MTAPNPTQRREIGKTGVTVSRLGFGTMTIGGFKAVLPNADAQAVLDAAWDLGLRFFDTAPQYGCGLAEEQLGTFLKQHSRADAVIATKVGKRIAELGSGGERQTLFPGGHDSEMVFDYSYDGTMRAIEASLTRLGIDRLDLVLIHDVTRHFHGTDGVHQRFAEAMAGAIPALRRLKEQGIVRAIGTGLKDVDIALAFAEHGGIDCVLVPGRMTLLEQSALTSGLLDRCHTLGVSVIAAAAFDSGILATGATEGATYGYREAEAQIVDRVRHLERICTEFGVPLQAAALQYPALHPGVASVLVSMRTPAEVVQNIDWMRFRIPNTLWTTLARQAHVALP